MKFTYLIEVALCLCLLVLFLYLNHLTLIHNAVIIHLLHHCWEKSLLVISEVVTVCSHNLIGWCLNLTIDNVFDRNVLWFTLNQSLWRYVVLHNQMWIQAIQVKRHNPLMHTYYRVFDVCANKHFFFLVRILRWNNDVPFQKIVMYQNIPHTNLCIYIVVVNLGIIRERQCHINQLHLFIDTIYKLNVANVVFNKLLMV